MSDEYSVDNLLVDQKDALGFYFDSLLSPEENELEAENITQTVPEQLAKDTPQVNVKEYEQRIVQPSEDPLQVAKDFLYASKLRQKEQTPASQQVIIDSKIDVVEKNVVAEAIVNKASTENSLAKAVSSDSAEFKPSVSERSQSNPSIVFASKDKDGKVSEQVLIPRSQQLASSSSSFSIESSIASTIEKQDEQPEVKIEPEHTEDVNRHAIDQPKDLQSASIAQVAQAIPSTQEAPNLDLSLFLPKIKTLSDDEIAQQIKALTQVAVSQAQVESDLAHSAELAQVSQNIANIQAEDNALIRNINNAPAWAVPDFQVLLFAVAGLKMAVPLSELNGIVEWGDEYITEMPGHKPWYLGIIQNQGNNVPVIDTLQQVVPKNRWPTDYVNTRKFKHIILIDNGRWGLACETVLEVLTLKTDSVKWRSTRTKRRWLMGTVIEHMCALLDSSEFATMLKTGDDSLLN